jgi:hypothetical protein
MGLGVWVESYGVSFLCASRRVGLCVRSCDCSPVFSTRVFLGRFGLNFLSSRVSSASCYVVPVSMTSMVTSSQSFLILRFAIWCAMRWVPSLLLCPCESPFSVTGELLCIASFTIAAFSGPIFWFAAFCLRLRYFCPCVSFVVRVRCVGGVCFQWALVVSFVMLFCF